ncbi:MAG: hypothetical protein IRY94_15230, partial [Rhodospirillaceae bacterium]|nr:hypothetical protein [Rhodospirillaceae bacterium]
MGKRPIEDRRRRQKARTVRFAVAVLALLAAAAILHPVLAQSPQPPAAPAAEPLTAAEIDSLIATIEDPEARARLVAQLRLLRRAQEGA